MMQSKLIHSCKLFLYMSILVAGKSFADVTLDFTVQNNSESFGIIKQIEGSCIRGLPSQKYISPHQSAHLSILEDMGEDSGSFCATHPSYVQLRLFYPSPEKNYDIYFYNTASLMKDAERYLPADSQHNYISAKDNKYIGFGRFIALGTNAPRALMDLSKASISLEPFEYAYKIKVTVALSQGKIKAKS